MNEHDIKMKVFVKSKIFYLTGKNKKPCHCNTILNVIKMNLL